MYNEYFGFRERPFNITPDPRFFYANAGHEEAYANLFYGIHERKGFIVLTGEVGTGKTTLLRKLIESLENSTRFVLFYNTTLTFEELLDFTFAELGLEAPLGGRLQKIQALNRFLINELAQGGTVALLIDEAQNLSDDVLENLRLLSNLETAQEKLLQIVLVGQPELDVKLAQPHLRQLKQRITTRCHLTRLRDVDVSAFISYRLQIVGCLDSTLFSPEAVQRISVYCQGIPRLINVLCDSALLIAYGASQKIVTPAMIDEVARDLQFSTQIPRKIPFPETTPSTPFSPDVTSRKEHSQPAPSLTPPIGTQEKQGDQSEISLNLLVRESPIPPSFVTNPRFAWVGFFALMLLGSFLLYSKPLRETMFSSKTGREPHISRSISERITGIMLSLNERLAVLFAPLIPKRREHAQPQNQLAMPHEVTPPVIAILPPLPDREPSFTTTVDAAVTGDLSATMLAEADQPRVQPEPTTDLRPSPPTQERLLEQKSPQSPQESESSSIASLDPTTINLPREQQRDFLQPGETISTAVRNIYGNYNSLALDLIKEFNPHLEDLDRVVAGQKIWFPSFSLDTLLRMQDDGTYHLIVATFRNHDPAERFARKLREQNYQVQVLPRRVSESVLLHRVEIINLSNREEAQHAWHFVTPTNVFFVTPKTIESIDSAETISPQGQMEDPPETGL